MSDGMLIDFNELRHDEEYHLGLGDIRLTIGMQGDIEKNFAFWIEETKKLQARIELKDNIIEMADENVKILKARISELEEELTVTNSLNIALQTSAHRNQIKAEGIREMVEKAEKVSFPLILADLILFAKDYADKLEKGE